ncbi:hypothetical protein ACFX14_004414 [Malus domestica]|uniref:25S rRNA (uridine-N(3))-methyltransferase BMT5-like domain-containing protein n=1 Tax=Malus domestica TaxID=3750 RepID=A0A498IWF1_MALDO|nr:hypothetical protein DVH24_021898 [Malus domestica]
MKQASRDGIVRIMKIREDLGYMIKLFLLEYLTSSGLPSSCTVPPLLLEIKHYSSFHKILLVGEGDFSFALCLAKSFGSAKEFKVKYSKAMKNLMELENMGCKIFHGVDVHTMLHHPQLTRMEFDGIIFNFPHAGCSNFRCSSEKKQHHILSHQSLVKGYFKSSREMLTRSGEIHVTHKTSYPFTEWEIENLAEEAGLFLVKEEKEFSIRDYPDYLNKRGAGKCDVYFHVGEASTSRFPKCLYPPAASSFRPGALSISTWSDDIVDMACT